MTTTTATARPYWTHGRNGHTWVGMPARVFVAPDAEGFNLYVDGTIRGTFGSMRDAQRHAETRYADVLAGTRGSKGPLSALYSMGR